jgi:hypothetical protein
MTTPLEIGDEFVKNSQERIKVKLRDVKHDEPVVDILEHFGVKGMHWGVRREEIRTNRMSKRTAKEEKRRANPNRTPAPVRVSDSIGVSSVKKTTIKTVGGEDHPAHADAIKVAVSRQKLKRSGIHTLSNEELQQMAARMNLEAQVHSLQSKRKKSVGQGFVDTHLAKAQKDPYAYAIKTHHVSKQAKNFMSNRKTATA